MAPEPVKDLRRNGFQNSVPDRSVWGKHAVLPSCSGRHQLGTVLGSGTAPTSCAIASLSSFISQAKFAGVDRPLLGRVDIPASFSR